MNTNTILNNTNNTSNINKKERGNKNMKENNNTIKLIATATTAILAASSLTTGIYADEIDGTRQQKAYI